MRYEPAHNGPARDNASKYGAQASTTVGATPIQRAIMLVLGAYAAACRTLTAADRDVLRDILATRLARDYVADVGQLDTREWAA